MRELSQAQCRQRLRTENPWWDAPGCIPENVRRLRRRAYFEPFTALLKERRVQRAIVLMGPRRVGKTVLLKHAVQHLMDRGASPRHIAYLSVDSPVYMQKSLEELAEYAWQESGRKAGEPAFLLLDEIQYLKDWERHLKIFVDDHPEIKCVASGSAAAALRRQSMESGAGRFTDFLLPPLTFHEHLELQDLQGLVTRQDGIWNCDDLPELNNRFLEYLNFGGYPEALRSEPVRADLGRYLQHDIIDKVLLRDLPSMYGIQDVQELNHLFAVLALNTAQEISPATLSGQSGITAPTLRRYLQYLEAAFLIKIVHRIDHNARRLKKPHEFKVYLTNASMHAALFGPIAKDDPHIGSLVETAVFAQWFHGRLNLHYARWKSGRQSGEVDIVHLNRRQQPEWGVEVKWSDSALDSREKRRPLQTLMRKHKGLQALCTTRTRTGRMPMAEDGTLHYLPTALYCYLVGYHVARNPHWDHTWEVA